MSELLEKMKKTVIEGWHKDIQARVQEAIDAGLPLETIINDGLIAAMDVVGQRFSKQEIFVPEMLVSAVTMKKGLDIVKPLIVGTQTTSKGKVMICTVKGDIHDIGKNLVVMMLEGAGYDVVDLGVDITVDKVIEEIAGRQPDVLGLSALLTTSMPEMVKVIDKLNAAGLRDKVKVMVGGAPVDGDFARKIGADGYGKDAAEAVSLCKRLMSGEIRA